MTAISVVVPAYNIAPFVGDCLASVVAQDIDDWECIVVDDCSTDATAARVREVADRRVRLQVQSANGGVSAARNAGLAAACGCAVMFLDGDDLLHPQALRRLLAPLQADARCVASFGPFRKILENGEPYPQQKPLSLQSYPSGDVLLAMLRENFLANGGHVLVRTQTAREVGGFDPALRLSEDWEFWCRLAAAGPFRYIGNEREVFYLRMRAGSSSGGLSRQWANHQASIEAVFANPALRVRFTPSEWARLRRRVQASHMWEAGRVNFTYRSFATARRLMLRSLLADPRPKRLALFGIAQVSQALDRSIVSRLRFHDHDQRLTGV